MTARPGWRVEASRTLLRDRWIDLRVERVVTTRGAVLDPYYLLDFPDWVAVVALTDDDRLVLVRQWRQGAGAWLLELPGGAIDAGEDPATAAMRELREETGFTARAFRTVTAVWSDPSRNTNRIHTVLAEGAWQAGPPALEPGEDLAHELVPVAEILARMDEGVLGHGLHPGGLLVALRAAGRIRF